MDRNDIELTDEVVEVKRRPRSGIVVSVRLSPSEADKLQDLAEAKGLTISQIARQAIGAYLKGEIAKSPVVWPWMGTTNGETHLELTYTSFGSTVGTTGEAQEPVTHEARSDQF